MLVFLPIILFANHLQQCRRWACAPRFLDSLDRTQVTVPCVLKQTWFSFFVIYFIFQRNDKDYDNIITIRNCRDRIRSLLISKESHSVAQFRYFEVRTDP